MYSTVHAHSQTHIHTGCQLTTDLLKSLKSQFMFYIPHRTTFQAVLNKTTPKLRDTNMTCNLCHLLHYNLSMLKILMTASLHIHLIT